MLTFGWSFPSFLGLGDLDGGAFNSAATGVSANGQFVVGQSSSSFGTEAFSWSSSGGLIALGDLPGGSFGSVAHAVSADGSVITGWGHSGSGQEAVRWVGNAAPMGLGDLSGGSFGSRALAVSADGSVIVGDGHSSLGREAFRWESTLVGLGVLQPGDQSVARGVSADGAVVVGDSGPSDSSHIEAFRWTSANGLIGLGDLEGGGFRSSAIAISADANVIVGFGESWLGIEAVRWNHDGTIAALGDLDGGDYYSYATAASADGSVIVGVGTVHSGPAAFIWSAATGIRDLRSVLMSDLGLDMTGWLLTAATGVSADGVTIAGNGVNPDGFPVAWVAHIPEPASLCFIIALLPIRRCRSRWSRLLI